MASSVVRAGPLALSAAFVFCGRLGWPVLASMFASFSPRQIGHALLLVGVFALAPGGLLWGLPVTCYSQLESAEVSALAVTCNRQTPSDRAAGSVTSTAAALTVVDARATHAGVGSGYVAGGTVTITQTLTYTGTCTGLGWQMLLPAGWSYASGGGAEGDARPAAGTTALLEWAWTTVPASPVTFTVTLNVPAGHTGDKALASLAIFRLAAGPTNILVKADPLTLSPVTNHSADADRNFRVSLIELTRVIELYNTRTGTTRTGAYNLQAGTEDGFAPEPSRAGSTVVTFARYHTADGDRNGKLSLVELTRVIELYNFRSGTTRTGAYRVQGGTEDGFAPGP